MSISDKFQNTQPGLSGPVQGGFDIVPADGADLPEVTRGLMVTSAGDLAVVLKNGDAITLPGLTPGVIYPVRATRVEATGTTATGVKGLV
jgi:hypothetical protein